MIEHNNEAPRWMATLWSAALLLLPLTTPGFLPLGQTLVRPPSMILFGIVALAALGHRQTRRRLMSDFGVRLLLVFASWALLCGAWAVLHDNVPAFKNYTPWKLSLRAALTLIAGGACYVSARAMLQFPCDVRRWWPFIATGMLVSVAWAIVQRLAYTESGLPVLGPVVEIVSQALSGSAEPPFGCSLHEARPHGLAYEPSWLASQTTLLLIPVGISWLVYEIGWRRLLGAVAAGSAMLGVALGSSRIGFVTILAASFSAIFTGAIHGWSRLAWISTAFLLCAGVGSILAWRSPYFQAMVTVDHSTSAAQKPPVDWPASDASFQWAARTNFLPRIAAAHAAVSMASTAPIHGVGLGLYAMHFPAHVASYGLQSGEVHDWANPDPAVGRMPNAKNMALRLAAETGLVGLVLWLIFVAWHWSRGWGDSQWRLLAIPAAIALIADWVSIDSFAMPQAWILCAIIVAYRSEDRKAWTHCRI